MMVFLWPEVIYRLILKNVVIVLNNQKHDTRNVIPHESKLELKPIFISLICVIIISCTYRKLYRRSNLSIRLLVQVVQWCKSSLDSRATNSF